VSDESFSIILDGIYKQSSRDVVSGRINLQYLQSLIYSNDEFGIKSLKKIEALIHNLFEIAFNNLHLGGG